MVFQDVFYNIQPVRINFLNISTIALIKIILKYFTLKTAAWGEPNSMNGGLPVAISTIVQPRDQMSAYNAYHNIIIFFHK